MFQTDQIVEQAFLSSNLSKYVVPSDEAQEITSSSKRLVLDVSSQRATYTLLFANDSIPDPFIRGNTAKTLTRKEQIVFALETSQQ